MYNRKYTWVSRLRALSKEIEKRIAPFSDDPHFDALEFVTAQLRRGHNKVYPDRIKPEVIDDFVARVEKKEPVSKILGERGFWRSDFKVTKDVLDPRPDSESIIETVIGYYHDERYKKWRILDIGTGSGCLILSLLLEFRCATGVGVDVSKEALAVARENGALCDNVRFVEGDFYSDSFCDGLGEFDIIVSNPPYIPTKEIDNLADNVRLYDPLIALDGGEDGLSAYRALSKRLKHILAKGGKIFFEIGKGQEKDVRALMEKEGYTFLDQFTDYSKIIRVLVFSYEKE